MKDYTEFEYECFCEEVTPIPAEVYEDEILTAFESYMADYDEFVKSLVALLNVDEAYSTCDYTCLDNFIGLLLPQKRCYEISLKQYIKHHWFNCTLDMTFKTWIGAHMFAKRLLDDTTNYELTINRVI